MKCNLCGCSEFKDMKSRKSVRCVRCGSLERTRLLWMYLERLALGNETRVLHLAPEKGIYDKLSTILGEENYVCADIDPPRYAFARNCRKLDLCELNDEPENSYDLILHSHVLEHVPCNIGYTLHRLHSMLKPDGLHICIIPFLPGRWDECFGEIGDEERQRRFGQHDHVRRYGSDDIPSHLGKLLRLPETFDASGDFPAQVLIEANIPEISWRGFHTSTVLSLRKYDMRLLRE